MTRKEAAELARLRLRVALAFSNHPEPGKLPPPGKSAAGEFVSGWRTLPGLGTTRVAAAWSRSATHGSGRAPKSKGPAGAFAGAISVFASKRDALVAARLDAEKVCAAWLSEIDRQIADESD